MLGHKGRTVDVRPDSENAERPVPFLERLRGEQILYTDGGITYNPSTNTLSVPSFSGSGSGLTGLTVAASAISGLIQLNQLAESAITLGDTALALGSTTTTLTGLTSVTSNLFVGDGSSLTNLPFGGEVTIGYTSAATYPAIYTQSDNLMIQSKTGGSAKILFATENYAYGVASFFDYTNGNGEDGPQETCLINGRSQGSYAMEVGNGCGRGIKVKSLTSSGNGIFGNAASQHSIVRPDSVELGIGREDDGLAYIDFHGSPSVDYSTRLIRGDGVDGSFYVTNTGQGVLALTQNNLGMYIDSAGNVGIGTAAPLSKLHVEGDMTILTAAPSIQMYDSAAAANDRRVEIFNDGDFRMVFSDDNGGNENPFLQATRLTGATQTIENLYLKGNTVTIEDGTDASSARVTVNSTGMSIGNTALLTKFSVTGASSAVTSNGLDGIVQITTGNGAQLVDKLTMGVVDGAYSWLQAYKYVHPSFAYADIVLNSNGGNVGIGTTTPDLTLDVNGESIFRDTINAGGLFDSTRYGGIQVCDIAGDSLIGYVRAGNYALVSGFVTGTNDFAFAGWSLAGTGVKLVYGATAWTSTSDERTKDIKSEITGALGKLSGIRCVRFRYKTDCQKDKYMKCRYERERIGFIAQDVQKVFPEAVHDTNGELGLTYQDMIVVNTSAIKELSEENTRLRTRLESLEQRLLKIENPSWFRGVKRERDV